MRIPPLQFLQEGLCDFLDIGSMTRFPAMLWISVFICWSSCDLCLALEVPLDGSMDSFFLQSTHA